MMRATLTGVILVLVLSAAATSAQGNRRTQRGRELENRCCYPKQYAARITFTKSTLNNDEEVAESDGSARIGEQFEIVDGSRAYYSTDSPDEYGQLVVDTPTERIYIDYDSDQGCFRKRVEPGYTRTGPKCLSKFFKFSGTQRKDGKNLNVFRGEFTSIGVKKVDVVQASINAKGECLPQYWYQVKSWENYKAYKNFTYEAITVQPEQRKLLEMPSNICPEDSYY